MANTSLMEYLNGIATAVQAKTGSTKKIKLKDIASEIAKIDTFGTHEFLDPITVTTNGIIDVTNYSSIKVQVADVDDLAVYFADDGDGYYSVVYKDYGTRWNEETQQNETIGYTSSQFEQGAHNFACLHYNSSNGIHNESLYFGQLDSDEIAIPNHSLYGEDVNELEVVQLGAGAYRNNTYLAYYNSSGYVDIYDSVVSSGDILVFNGDGFSSLSGSSTDVLVYDSNSGEYGSVSLSSRGDGLIYDGEEITQFSLDTNNIMYNLSRSSIYNAPLSRYEVIYYNNNNNYKVTSKSLSSVGDGLINNGSGVNQISLSNNKAGLINEGGHRVNSFSLGTNNVMFNVDSSNIYNSSLSSGEVVYYDSSTSDTYKIKTIDLDDNASVIYSYGIVDLDDSANVLYGGNGSVNVVDLSDNNTSVLFYNQNEYDGNGSSFSSYEIDTVLLKDLDSDNYVLYPSNGKLQIGKIGYDSSGSNVSYVLADWGNQSIGIGRVEGTTIAYTDNNGLETLNVNGKIVYAENGGSDNASIASLQFPSHNNIFYYNSSNQATVSSLANSIAYATGSVVQVQGFTNTSVAYYNGSYITVETMSNYNSSWTYNSSSQNVYGKICAYGSLVNITEDMLKTLVDAGYFSPVQ